MPPLHLGLPLLPAKQTRPRAEDGTRRRPAAGADSLGGILPAVLAGRAGNLK